MDGDYGGVERRSASRAPFIVKAVVQVEGERQLCHTLDLSASGMLLVPRTLGAVGARVRVDFPFPILRALRLGGVLARESVSYDHYAWGIQFRTVSKHLRQVLNQFVDQRLQGVPDDALEFRSGSRRNPSPTPSSLGEIERVNATPPPANGGSLSPTTTGPLKPAVTGPPARDAGFRRQETSPEIRRLYAEALRELDGDKRGRRKPTRRRRRG
jgi:hypothetical protein